MRKKLGHATDLVRTSAPPALEGRVIFSAQQQTSKDFKSQVLAGLLAAVMDAGVIKSESEFSTLRLAIDEALVNAAMHGNKYDATKKVRVLVQLSAEKLSILVADEGEGFREEDLPDPHAPENLLEESGRGVILIRGIMDEVSYWSGGTALLMVKRIAPPA